MTPNADDLIEILKKLVSQIDGLEGNVQGLVTQSHELNKEVQLTQEYHNELGVLNNLSESQPRSSLISALEDETRQIESLEAENGELRTAIGQHQQVLALIMAKYREQSERLAKVNALEARYRLPPTNMDVLRHRFMAESVHQMVGVLDEAAGTDDAKVQQQQELIERIREENGRLKKLLLLNKREVKVNKLETTNSSKDNAGELPANGDKQ